MEQPPNLAELEVPGEPGLYWCARHRKTQTRLRCGRCETPICPKCTRMGPTGARCPQCASNRSSHIYQLSPQHLALALATAVVLGSLAGWVARWPLIGLLTLFYAPAVGTLIGKAITRVTGGKRGTTLAVVAALGIVLGALIPIDGFLLFLKLNAVQGSLNAPIFDPLLVAVRNPFVWLYGILATSGAWYWLK